MSQTQGRVVGRSAVHDILGTTRGTYPIFAAACGRNLGMDVIEIMPSDGIATTCKGCLKRNEVSP